MLRRYGDSFEREIIREPTTVENPIIQPIVETVEKVIDVFNPPLVKPIEKSIEPKRLFITPIIKPISKTILRTIEPTRRIAADIEIDREIFAKRRIINDIRIPTFKMKTFIHPRFKPLVDPVKVIEITEANKLNIEPGKINLIDRFFIWVNSFFKAR